MNTSILNFPLWELSSINIGLLIATISVIHVFVAQFAVGGGFFLVMAERKAHQEKSRCILQWVHNHTKFFVLLTMVFGGLTGVGVWHVIVLASTEGTVFLVHQFIYAWAAEWVFFLCEIITLVLYAASFTRVREGLMSPRDHMKIGIVYGAFAFLSLFVINGIIAFMLSPGEWVTTGNFWQALFNPTFWPSLVFRFGLSLTLAGLFGLITAAFTKDIAFRTVMVRFCAHWICLPFILMVIGGIWYGFAVPEEARATMQRRTDDIRPFIRSFIDTAPLLFLAGMLLFTRLPHKIYKPYVVVMLLLGLTVAGSFEWVRETARRPWLVHGVIYSNGISIADGKIIKEKGILQTSGWAKARALGAGATQEKMQTITAEMLSPHERLRFGHFIYTHQCASCHGLGMPRLDIIPKVEGRGVAGILALLHAQGTISPYMPPFFGTDEERLIFAEWLATLEQNK